MKIKVTTFIALSLLSNLALAESHMLVIGGGGEPTGTTTIFDDGMKKLGANVKNSNWKYQLSFNGGHSETESILRTDYPNPVTATTQFTKANYAKLISDYKAKILSGDIATGDQLMIIVNTHGAANSGTSQKTHYVSASGGSATNLNSLSGSELVSLDDLADLVELTKQKGIKLGLVDLSCHSGHTLALKKNAPNACIITASGPVHYGYAGPSAFANKFLANLKPGANLESAFLKARVESTDASYPMISTDESYEIVDEVYKSITPYLYYYDPKADKLSEYVITHSRDTLICKRDEQFQDLISKINQLQSITGFSGAELKKLITEYKLSQDNILKSVSALGGSQLDKKEPVLVPVNFKSKKPLQPVKLNFDWQQIINSNPDSTISYFEGQKQRATSALEKAEHQAVIDAWNIVKKKKAEIERTYPRIKEYKAEALKLTQQIENSRMLADKISMQEKKFYDQLYRQKQSLNYDDPCRQIVF